MASYNRNLLAHRLLAFSLCLTIAGASGLKAEAIAGPADQNTANQAALLNNDGVKALTAGNFQLAIQKFEEALKLVPNYKFAIDNLAIAYNNLGLKLPPAQGIRQFHKSLFYNPQNTTTLQNLENVITYLNKNPKNFKDRVDLAKQARMSGDFEGAIVEYQAALRLKDDGGAWEDLGDVWRVRADDQKGLDNSIQAYQSALRAGTDQSKTAMVYVKLGQAFQAKKDLPNAIKAFGDALRFKSDDREVLEALKTGWEEALRENPTAPENHIGLGQALQYLGDFGQAEAEYNQALRLDKNNQIARKLIAGLGEARRLAEITKHINAGVDFQQRKQYDQAIAEYVAAFQMDPSNAAVMVNAGTAFQAKGDFTRALAAYQKALSIDPNNKDAQAGMKGANEQLKAQQLDALTKTAADLYKQGKYAESLAAYQKVLVSTPNDAAIHFNIAAALQQLKRIDEAIAEYKIAVSLDPKNEDYKTFLNKALSIAADPYIEKGLALHKQKDYPGALAQYQKALTYTPDNAAVHYNVASVYYSLQQYDKAMPEYARAMEIDKKGQIDDLWLMGQIDEHFNRGYDAIKKYKDYLAAAPTGKFIAGAKERLEALTKNPNDTVKIKSEKEIADIKTADESYQTAIKILKEKKYDEAAALLQKSIDLQPKEPAYPFGMYLVYLDKPDYKNARIWLDKAIALDPKSKEFSKAKEYLDGQEAQKVVEQAVAKQNAEDFTTAITLYQQALTLVPKNAQIWRNLASAFQANDQFAEAGNAYQKALEIDPKGEAADLFPAAAIDENFGRGPAALDKYRKYVAAFPTGQLTDLAQARIKALVANPNDVKKLPKRAEVKSAQAAQAAFDQAVKLQGEKKYDEALPLYLKAAQAVPTEPAFAVGVGAIYQLKGDLDNSMIWYQKAIDLAPKNAEYKQYLQGVQVAKASPMVEDAAKKFTAQDFAGAIAQYKNALQYIPNDASVHLDLGSAYQQSDDFANARTEYQKAYDLDKKGAIEALYFVAALDENFGQGAVALQKYRTYLTTNPSGKFVQYAKARVDALSKNPNDIVRVPTRAQAANAAETAAAFDEAVKLQQAGKFDEAEAKYNQLIQKDPKNASYIFARATNYQNKGDLDNAIKDYTAASNLDPANAEYKKWMKSSTETKAATIVDAAVKKQQAGDIAGAIAGYQEGLKLMPNNASLWTNLGIAYQNSDNFQGALDSYNKALAADPKAYDNLVFAAAILEHFNRGAEALQNYTKYLQYAPKGQYAKDANDRYQVLYFDKTKTKQMVTQKQVAANAAIQALYQEAVNLQQGGKLDEAIAKYQEGLKQDPRADYMQYGLGTAYQGKGDNENAMKAYQAALNIKPTEPAYKKALNDLKQIMAAPLLESAYKKQTTKDAAGGFDLNGATIDYEAALKIFDDPVTRLNLGTAYQAMKQFQKALDQYNRTILMDAKQADAYYYRATIYEALNQPLKAIADYRKYLQLQPAGPNAADSKARLKILGAK